MSEEEPRARARGLYYLETECWTSAGYSGSARDGLGNKVQAAVGDEVTNCQRALVQQAQEFDGWFVLL
jgi:hypothetical protein